MKSNVDPKFPRFNIYDLLLCCCEYHNMKMI